MYILIATIIFTTTIIILSLYICTVLFSFFFLCIFSLFFFSFAYYCYQHEYYSLCISANKPSTPNNAYLTHGKSFITMVIIPT